MGSQGRGKNALTPEQNERLRAIARDVIDKQYNGQQLAFARAIGFHQSQISRLLGPSGGAGPRLLQEICRAAGRDVREVLDGAPARVTTLDPRYEAAEAAIAFLSPEIPAEFLDEYRLTQLKSTSGYTRAEASDDIRAAYARWKRGRQGGAPDGVAVGADEIRPTGKATPRRAAARRQP